MINNISLAGEKERKAYEEYLKKHKEKFLSGNHKPGDHTCRGLCRDEIYFLDKIKSEQISYNVIKNKKKKQKKFYRNKKDIWVKNSWCKPLSSFTILKNKNKNKLLNVVQVNACVPCGVENRYSKVSTSGFCPLNLYSFSDIYRNSVAEGITNRGSLGFTEDGDSTNLYLPIEKKNIDIIAHFSTIALSNKKEISFIKIKRKTGDTTGQRLYFWATFNYKTFLKEQVIKRSKYMPVNPNGKFASFLDNYRKRILDLLNDNEIRYSDEKFVDEFYKRLPSKDELELLYSKFNEAREFHIQTRN